MALKELPMRDREKLNLWVPPAFRQRIRTIAEKRGTTESATVRWLLDRGMDWYEGLSREQRESA